MQHMLLQTTLALLYLKAFTQLVAVDGQVCGQRSDIDIRVLHKVILSLKVRLARMLHGLLQNLVIQIVMESQSILPQIVGYILGNSQTRRPAVLSLYLIEDDLLAILDHRLDQHLLYLECLFVSTVQTYRLQWLTYLFRRCLVTCSSCAFFLLLLQILGNHAVH